MLPRPAVLLTLALLGGWCLPARAQQLLPPVQGDALLLPTLVAPAPAPEVLPPTPVFTADPEPPPADALPCRPPPGWFVGLEAFLTRPYLSNIDSSSDGYEPVRDLDLTVAPLVTVGYRFENGSALLVSYRFLGAAGDADDWWGHWHRRIDTNWLDLDYRGRLYGPWQGFTLQWQAGARVASVVDDERNRLPGWWADDRLRFVGAGGHVGVDVNWYAEGTDLGVFGRVDVGGLLGRTTDRFRSVFQDVGGPIPSADTRTRTAGMFNGRAELGVSWTPATQRWLRFETGWQLFDFVWDGENFANFGPFVRCEIGF
jgi:hypothetical protein